MPVGAIERELHDACVRLAGSAAMARRGHERYLDGPGETAGRDLGGAVTALTAAYPWALGGFGYPNTAFAITMNDLSKILAFVTALSLFFPQWFMLWRPQPMIGQPTV